MHGVLTYVKNMKKIGQESSHFFGKLLKRDVFCPIKIASLSKFQRSK